VYLEGKSPCNLNLVSLKTLIGRTLSGREKNIKLLKKLGREEVY
jgi:hypothetical protein